jgi:acetyl esterase
MWSDLETYDGKEPIMAVDPQVQVLLDMLVAAGGPRFIELSPAEAREWFNKLRRPFEIPIGQITDRAIPGPAGDIPVRLYTPVDAAPGRLPVLVYFHGGGWVVGDIDSHDPVCRSLANASGCKIMSVDYRLAPEHPWPAAPDDCFAAVQWVVANAAALGVDASRLAIGGDSAGGNLSAAVTLRARAARGPHIAFQLLIYPALDASMALPSIAQNATGYFLEKAGMEWFYHHYIPDGAEVINPDISPLHADDLSGLPSAYVVTAEYDPLRDEGRAYAEKLKAAGVQVDYINYPTMIHGFFGFQATVDVSRQAVSQAGQALAKALAYHTR